MHIRVGYELAYACPQPTPMILMLNIHFTRVSDLVVADPGDLGGVAAYIKGPVATVDDP